MIKTSSDLKANPKNPRTVRDEKLSVLKRTLAEFGDLSGIIFNRRTGQLVGGHQRTKIVPPNTPVVITRKFEKPTKRGTVAEGYIVISGERHKYREVDWDATKEKAGNLAANKGVGEWDVEAVSDWLREIDEFGFDLDLTLFDEDERTAFTIPILETEEDEARDNEIPDAPKKARTKPGDIYVLGAHRLYCGDSTKSSSYKRLLRGKKVDLVFTSPPYNADTKFSNTNNDGALYENYSDDLPSDEYVKFTTTVLDLCLKVAAQYVFWNVNYNSNSRSEFLKQIVPYLDQLDETIVWKKTALPVPYGLTRTWEPIFVFKCFEGKKRITQDETAFNFWEVNNSGALDESHRAAFPVGLPVRALHMVKSAESVLDPFGGSGTTMIAAEKNGKSCYMIELDPIYCDVIVARWEKYTGKKAKRVLAKAPERE